MQQQSKRATDLIIILAGNGSALRPGHLRAPLSASSKDRHILPDGYTFGWKSGLSLGALPNLHSGGLLGYSSVNVLRSRERTQRLSRSALTPGRCVYHACTDLVQTRPLFRAACTFA
eukprot:scaffold10511_cov129-Isochrysis_galbana.AAC.2